MSLLDEYCRNPEQYYCVLYLDEDPAMAAKCYSSHHLHKLVPHAARVLSTVWGELGGDKLYFDWSPPIDATPFGELKYLNAVLFNTKIYRPMYVSHPLVEWVTLYGGNYQWLWRHGVALLEELERRLGRVHSCRNALMALEFMPAKLARTAGTWCDLPVVVPGQYVVENAVESYRNYYRRGGAGILNYKGSVKPNWL